MNRRPRYEVADPHPDYHDQGIPPRHEKTRPLRTLAGKTQETGRTNPHQMEGTQIMSTTERTAPEGFTPEYDYSMGKDGAFVVHDHEAPLFWMGPGISEPGIDVYIEFTPEHGRRVFTGDGIELQAQDLLRYSVKLLKLYDAATARP